MEKQTTPTPIPAHSKTVENVGQAQNNPIIRLARAMARRQARLDAIPPTAANLNDEAT